MTTKHWQKARLCEGAMPASLLTFYFLFNMQRTHSPSKQHLEIYLQYLKNAKRLF